VNALLAVPGPAGPGNTRPQNPRPAAPPRPRRTARAIHTWARSDRYGRYALAVMSLGAAGPVCGVALIAGGRLPFAVHTAGLLIIHLYLRRHPLT
jgi:hypothetical protein